MIMAEDYTNDSNIFASKVSSTKLRSLSNELQKFFTTEEVKQELQWWKFRGNCFKKQSDTPIKSNHFNSICGLCLANPKEQKWLNKFRKTGLRRLNFYLINSTKKEIQSKDIKLLTWCCLNLLSYYCSKRQVEECRCFKTNKIGRCKTVFRTALYLMLPEKQHEVVKSTIQYITLTSQWNSEDYDSFVLQELMSVVTKPELLIAKIIKQVEISQREDAVKEALNVACTLSNVLEQAYWDKYLFNHLLHNCFNTLLKIYLLCNRSLPSFTKLDNAKFRIVVKSCIKYFISNIKDNKGLVSVLDSLAKCLHDPTIPEDDIIEIMDLAAFCAQKHHTKYYRESITPDLLNLLLHDLTSQNKILALTTHKIFHHLLDRHGNEINFTEPVYYFKGRSHFTINYDYSIEDAQFVKSFFDNFLDGIHHCFVTFNEKYALITCYVTVCLIMVEIPDPVITINTIRALITIQNTVLKNKELSMTAKYQIHAIISAILSLICVIHDDQVYALKKYVEEVVRFRTENSPHLLPPLQNKYAVASHHTTEYHHQLYFLEEEILYALQRCWLSKRIQGSI